MEDTMKTLVYPWAWKQYRPNRYVVHESLVEDPGFYASDGIMITELAMRCIQRELDKRPSMKDVVKRLEGLQAVQLYGNSWNVKCGGDRLAHKSRLGFGLK